MDGWTGDEPTAVIPQWVTLFSTIPVTWQRGICLILGRLEFMILPRHDSVPLLLIEHRSMQQPLRIVIEETAT